MGKELEWKYAASAGALARLRREIRADWRTIEMESLYYDTPAGSLSARRWTLRLRRENGETVSCLKTPLEGRARGEWEVRGVALPEAVGPLLAAGAPPELETLLEGQPCEIVCGARFCRSAALLELDGAAVELALDEGVLEGGGRRAPLCELEAELKSGDSHTAEAFAAELAARYGLREEPLSKFQRAFALAEN